MVLHAVEPSSSITALLGPTNTGKTHRAVERMMELRSGMIGLPLRLLAREIYDRVSLHTGENQVALVTGEEKRIPARPRYWVCTVEAMPVDRSVDFLAVDEIQLSAHPQRGHVFTTRLLHARGRKETWFLGSDTMRPLVEQLVPTARIQSHPRLSTLRARSAHSLSALPPRTAVIAFSATDVYELADRVRRQRGGAAVVLGALSPRTRNAQVAMYQAGEVDCLVATDAIGMGLNLDVDHVAFAGLSKFDGRRRRALAPAELGQIAGRAGRHLNHGSFATVAPVELPSDVALAVETQRFRPVRRVVWRNADLDFSSLQALEASLKQRPRRRCFQLVDRAEDLGALLQLRSRADIRERITGSERVELLWQVCQIPDFRRVLVEHHAPLLGEIFLQLTSAAERLDADWVAERVQRLDQFGGHIEDLMMRIESIRIWTYVAHQGRWLADEKHWQERTQAVEDRLSDALHERLLERFVEQRSRGYRGRPRGRSRTRGSVAGEAPAPSPSSPFAKLAELDLAVRPQAPAAESARHEWLDELVDADHERFRVEADGGIYDARGHVGDGATPLAQLTRGVDLLHPEVRLSLEQSLGAGGRSRIERRLRAFARDLVEQSLGVLHDERAEQLSPAGRGLVYQLEQGLGTALAVAAGPQLAELTSLDRELFDELDIVLGARFIYQPGLLKPAAVRRRVALCAAHFGPLVTRLAPERAAVSMARSSGAHDLIYLAIGYPLLGARAVRADVAERVHQRLATAATAAPFAVPEELSSWLGCSRAKLAAVVRACGYERSGDGWRAAASADR